MARRPTRPRTTCRGPARNDRPPRVGLRRNRRTDVGVSLVRWHAAQPRHDPRLRPVWSSNSSGSQSPRCKRHSTRSSTHTWPSPPPRTSPTLYDGCFLYDFGACRMWLIDLDEYRPGPARSCRRRLGAGLNPQRQHARQQRSTVCTHVGRIHPGRSLLEHLVVSAPGHPTRRRRLAGPAPGTETNSFPNCMWPHLHVEPRNHRSPIPGHNPRPADPPARSVLIRYEGKGRDNVATLPQ